MQRVSRHFFTRRNNSGHTHITKELWSPSLSVFRFMLHFALRSFSAIYTNTHIEYTNQDTNYSSLVKNDGQLKLVSEG